MISGELFWQHTFGEPRHGKMSLNSENFMISDKLFWQHTFGALAALSQIYPY